MRQGRHQQQEQQVLQVQTLIGISGHPVHEILDYRREKTIKQYIFRQHRGPKRQERQEP